MTNEPGDRPDDDANNPFRGTPFEQMFSAFGGGAGGAGMPDLSALMSQMQAMMQPHEGAVNWNLAKDVARRTVAQEPDPTPTSTQRSQIADALRLADHWLDSATDLPSGVSTSAAWSRAEWVEETVDVWRRLVEPVAEHVVSAMGSALPEEAKAMAGPLMGILNQAGGAMFGTQVGQALGGLAGEVLTASDIGLPLGPDGKAALVPANVAAFAEGLDVSDEDVLLYLALREAAHQRLFGHVPWLRAHLLATVEDYGRGTSIDVSKIEESMRGIDPTNPAALQEALEGGLFEPQKTPAQQAALSPPRDDARARRGLGRRGGRPGDRGPDALCRQAAGGHPPPPRLGRAGRVHLRRAGRARAAAAPAARRLRAVGIAAVPAGTPGP